MSLIIPANSAAASGGTRSSGGFDVANSCRFDDGSSAYMHRTPSAGNRRTMTLSVWIKGSSLSDGSNNVLGQYNSSNENNAMLLVIEGAGKIMVWNYTTSAYTMDIRTNRQLRDNSAWYNIVVAVDTTQATAENRVKVYVNGVQETSLAVANYPAENLELFLNQGVAQNIGTQRYGSTVGGPFDGYMAEFCFIDGTQNAVTDFGEFDEDSGIWKPIDVSGLTFGTNGYYLDFEDSSALGNDVSGNDNDFTTVNLAAIDQSTDTCTNNFATMNPLDNFFAGSTFTEGNTTVDMTTSGVETFNTSTFAVSSGLWYAECKLIDSSSKPMIGVSHSIPIAIGNVLGNSGFGYAYMGEDGQVKAEGSNGAYGATYTTNDIIGVYLDLTANKLYFAKNGALQNSGTGVSITAAASTANGHYFFGAGKRHSDNNQVSWNFGNPSFTGTDKADANGYGSFEYDPSVGTFDGASKDFYALCTKNLAEYG